MPGNDSTGEDGSRLVRWAGLIRLTGARLRFRLLSGAGRQTWLSILGVAVAVAMLLVVTGISLGLLGPTTQATSADFWIVPEGSASSAVVGVEGQRLGRVHPVTERIERISGVTDATPVLLSLSRTNRSTEGTAETADGDADGEYVLAVGVIPGGATTDQVTTVAGLATTDLTSGDPYYANGSYAGKWTGEAVVSAGAAETLDLQPGSSVRLGGRRESSASFRVVAVRETTGAGIAQLPIVVVHLSELQTLVGATESDSADQILVQATDTSVQGRLERVYPQTDVLTQDELVAHQAASTRLPVAVAVITLGVTLVVGVLFVVTSLGFEVAESGQERAVMAALGVSRGSRAILVAVEAVLVAAAGGVLGLVLWLGSLPVVNALGRQFGDATITVFHPYLAAYGLAIALSIGLFTVPYLLVLSDRTTGTQRLGE